MMVSKLSILLLLVGYCHSSIGSTIPAVGIGVGNLNHALIPSVLDLAVNHYGLELIDTAMASRNHHIIGKLYGFMRQVDETIEASTEFSKSPFIVTKIWYTYLGYKRTLYAVNRSLHELSSDKRVLDCVLIHWPRCDDKIPWMNCEEEEENLPAEVKRLGEAPHLAKDPVQPWKESWRALEELQLSGKIGHIGVSNFAHSEMEELFRFAKVKPTLFQGNIWIIFFDPYLMRILKKNQVLVQVYNSLNGILPCLSKCVGTFRKRALNAFSEIKIIANETVMQSKNPICMKSGITGAQMILLWLVHEGYLVIPRASTREHIEELALVQQSKQIELQPDKVTYMYFLVEELLRAANQMPLRDGRKEL